MFGAAILHIKTKPVTQWRQQNVLQFGQFPNTSFVILHPSLSTELIKNKNSALHYILAKIPK
jgi:hypothetical protein